MISFFRNSYFGRERIWLVLAVVTTGLLSLGLFRANMDLSIRSLVPDDDEAAREYDRALEEFGNETLLTVSIEAPDVFVSDVLLFTKELTGAARSIHGVEEVRSLYSFPVLKKKERAVHIEPLLKRVPELEEVNELREAALADPLLTGNFVDREGTLLAVHLVVAGEADEVRVVSILKGWIEAHRPDPEKSKVEVSLLGHPVMRYNLSGLIWRELLVFSVLISVLLIGIVWWSYRSWVAVFFPSTAGVLAMMGTFGFMGISGVALNPLMINVLFLVLIVACSESLHLLSEFQMQKASHDPGRSVILAVRAQFLPISLTALTSFLGFFLLCFSSIHILQEFARVGCVGVLIGYVITLLVAPAFLGALGRVGIWRPSRWIWLLEPSRCTAGKFLFLGGIVGVLILGAVKVRPGMNFSSLYSFEPEYVEDAERYRAKMINYDGFRIVIDTGTSGGVRTLEAVAKIDEFVRKLENEPGNVVSMATPIRYVYSRLFPELPSELPDRGSTFANTWSIASKYVRPLVNGNESATLVQLRVLSSDAAFVEELRARITRVADDTFPEGWHVGITGNTVLFSQSYLRITREVIVGLAVLAMAICLICAISLRSIPLALASLVPNVLPVLTVFGVMGWSGIPLGLTQFPLLLVSLGVAVDDTLHLALRFRKNFEMSGCFEEAMKGTLEQEVRPICVVSIGLIVSLVFLSFSSFEPTREVSLLLSAALAAGLVADLFLLPPVVRLFLGKKGAECGRSPSNKGGL